MICTNTDHYVNTLSTIKNEKGAKVEQIMAIGTTRSASCYRFYQIDRLLQVELAAFLFERLLIL